MTDIVAALHVPRRQAQRLYTYLVEQPFFIMLLVSWNMHLYLPQPRRWLPWVTIVVTAAWLYRTDFEDAMDGDA